MPDVLVTGATGTLGSSLVPALLGAGHRVRALSRRARLTNPDPDVVWIVGDVRTGAGLAEALDGVDVVIHAATSAYRRARSTEVDGTSNVLGAARRGGVAHLLYVSIVGVDRVPLGYYKAKLAAEHLVQAGDVAWSIVRATQFHDQVASYVGAPLFPTTSGLSFQPIAVSDVSAQLVDHVGAGPSEAVVEIGGPEIRTIRELRNAFRSCRGRAARLVPVPRVGMMRHLDAGHHLAPDARVGARTFGDWLEARR